MEVPGVGGSAEEDLDDDVSSSLADDDDDARNRDVLNRRFSFLEKADDEKKRGASLLIFVSLCFEVRKVGAATKSVDAIGKELCNTRVTKVKMRKQRTRSSGVPSKSCPMVNTTSKIFYKALLNYYY
jgi:hypothetical protein